MASPNWVHIIETSDILCGKDKACVNHPGSKRYRDVIESFRFRYQRATTKFEKMTITKEIYDSLKTGCRFLKYSEQQQSWEELSSMAARDKIGHSLRFANRTNRRKNTRGHKRSNSNSSTDLSIASSKSASSTSTCSSGLPQYCETKGWGSLVDHMANAFPPKPIALHKPKMLQKPQLPTAVSKVLQEPAINQFSQPSNKRSKMIVEVASQPSVNKGHQDNAAVLEVFSSMANDIPPAMADIQTSMDSYGDLDILSALSDPVGEWDKMKFFDFSSQ